MQTLEQNFLLWQKLTSLLQKESAINIRALPYTETQLDNWIHPWLEKKYHGEMHYMENHAVIRQSPSSIFPDTKSFILIAFPYFHPVPSQWENEPLLSCYAWGYDYHKHIKKVLKCTIQAIQLDFPWFQARSFVDSAPIPEKILASKSGLGWIGQNSLLINPQYGSYVFLAEIACNVLFTYKSKQKNRCGRCQKCIIACPTGALLGKATIDARKCISYLTIEKQSHFTLQEAKSLGKHVFGCDICQQVCPWNRFTKTGIDKYKPRDSWTTLSLQDWEAMTEESFLNKSIASPLRRSGYHRIQRNLKAILSN